MAKFGTYSIKDIQNIRTYEYQSDDKIHAFGIYDGDETISKLLQKYLISLILEQYQLDLNMNRSIIHSFEQLDMGLKDFLVVGSTATVVLIIETAYLYIANVGDSEAVLMNPLNGLYRVLTEKHDSCNLSEISRINQIEETIWNKQLTVTRAFGNFNYKRPQVDHDWITSIPYIYKISKIEIPYHSYIILASNGLWTAMNYGEVVDEIKHLYSQNIDTVTMARLLVEKAYQKGISDNITVTIIRLF